MQAVASVYMSHCPAAWYIFSLMQTTWCFILNVHYLSVPLHPGAPIVLPRWLLDAIVPNVFAIEPRVPVRFHVSSNGCSPGFRRARSFRRFFRDKSISEAVAETCVCEAVVTHGGDILSLDIEKNPCCDILWPNCGRFILIFEFITPAKWIWMANIYR